MRAYASPSVSRAVVSATMRSSSVPIRRTVPAVTASGRSVFSRITSTGLPSDGASSWTPPESVSTTSARSIIRVNSP